MHSDLPEELKAKPVRKNGTTTKEIYKDSLERPDIDLILNSITDAFLSVNRDIEITYTNQAFQSMFGKEAEEMKGRKLLDLLPLLQLNKFDTLTEIFLNDNSGFQFKEYLPDLQKWISVSSVPVHGNLNIIIKDITIEKKYEQIIDELILTLKESKRLESIINKSPIAVVLIDVSGNVVWANNAFTKLSSYSLEEAIGKNLGSLVHGQDTNPQTLKMIEESIQKKESLRVEILNYSKTGRKFWLDLRLEPVYHNNELTGYLAFKNDITQKKSDELAIKERNETISKVSFITSHELRHEFSKIMMLLNEGETVENSYEELKTIFNLLKEPAKHINSIISKINDNLKHDPEQPVFQISPSVEEICLIEDDKLTNFINSKMIRKITPTIPVKVYENIDSALETIRVQPTIRRLIFLDLNMPKKSGWEFLDACMNLNSSSHVLMLTSSIDPRDVEKSKKYKIVEDYICKPLTANVFQEFAKKYCTV